MRLAIDPTLSIGSLFTGISVLVSMLALLVSWSKDQRLRAKEYADHIRRSAGLVTAKIERWMQLSERFFENIQPVLTDADVNLVTSGNVVTVRDKLWHSLVTARAEASQRILDEEIEIAYADLYGYDPRIRDLFNAAVATLRMIDEQSFTMLLEFTQADVLSSKKDGKHFQSARLGNVLRTTCAAQKTATASAMNLVVSAFQLEMTRLIQAKDQDVLRKRVHVELPVHHFDEAYFSLSRSVRAGRDKPESLAAGDVSADTSSDMMKLEIDRIADISRSSWELMEHICMALHARIPKYNWVGFFVVDEQDTDFMVLGPYAGNATPHTRIRLGAGINGGAASSGTTVVVDDINLDPRYLACSIETKSEIVVPVFVRDEVVGVLDLESHLHSAFGEADEAVIKHCAKTVGAFLQKQGPEAHWREKLRLQQKTVAASYSTSPIPPTLKEL